jgi:hypothetical protein
MLSLAIFGGNRVDGSMLDPGERIIALALFGGIEFDFASVPPPATEVVVVAMFGGATFKVRARQPVRVTGLSIFGGRSVEPLRRLPPQAVQTSPPADGADDLDLPLEINAYAAFGGVTVKRVDEALLAATAGAVR